MRLPRVRIRTLMIAVAVAGGGFAVCVEADRLLRVSRSHRRRAVQHAYVERVFRESARSMEALAAKRASYDVEEALAELVSAGDNLPPDVVRRHAEIQLDARRRELEWLRGRARSYVRT